MNYLRRCQKSAKFFNDGFEMRTQVPVFVGLGITKQILAKNCYFKTENPFAILNVVPQERVNHESTDY